MSRTGYFDYIEEKINLLATRINARGRLNLLNLNNVSEVFYAYFLNELYGWKLGDENTVKQNLEGIDLTDHTNEFVIQVSATSTKDKIETSLEKKIISRYPTYTFKFVSIANDSDDLRSKVYKNPYGIKFDPKNDIIDKNKILKDVRNLEIDDQRRVYNLVRKELGNEVDTVKLDSNLASIINILAKENWDGIIEPSNLNSFEIERKIDFNQLNVVKQIVYEYAIFKTKVEKMYEMFDSLAANKSYSVLQLISKLYLQECLVNQVPDEIFLKVGEKIRTTVEESANFEKIEFDILVLCIDILLVDAFIRCKIFKNPPNYNYVAS